MAEAKITTVDGIVVEVHGTPEEVASVAERLSSGARPASPAKKSANTVAKAKKPGKTSLTDLINDLREEQYFKAQRGLGDVRKKLGDMGHHYPLTTLSGVMQGEVKARRLRRFKEKGKYVYVQ